MKCLPITILATQRSLGHQQNLDNSICFDLELLINREQSWETGYYLLEESGNRRFAYKMGLCEAGALYSNLKNPEEIAPSMDDGFASAIFSLGGKLQYVIVDKISLDLKS